MLSAKGFSKRKGPETETSLVCPQDVRESPGSLLMGESENETGTEADRNQPEDLKAKVRN